LAEHCLIETEKNDPLYQCEKKVIGYPTVVKALSYPSEKHKRCFSGYLAEYCLIETESESS
jgi:hypothetical protein